MTTLSMSNDLKTRRIVWTMNNGHHRTDALLHPIGFSSFVIAGAWAETFADDHVPLNIDAIRL